MFRIMLFLALVWEDLSKEYLGSLYFLEIRRILKTDAFVDILRGKI